MDANEQVTTGEDIQAQAAAGQATGEEPQTPAAAEQPAETNEVAGLKAALEAERAKRQQTEQMVNQVLLRQGQQPAAPAAVADDMFTRLGMRPEDLYTEDGVKRFTAGVEQLVQHQVRQGLTQYGTQQFLADHPDFAAQVGQAYAGQFVPAPAFQAACAHDPYLQAAVNGLIAGGDTLSAMRLAYDRARKAAKPTNVPQNPVPGPAQQTAAQTLPTSPASVGGGGAFGATAQLGQMSDEQFAQLDRQAAATPGTE